MYNKRKSIIIAFISLIILLCIDFFSKKFMAFFLKNINYHNLIPKLLSLQYVENRGAAFGILSGKLLPIVILTPFIVILAMWLYIKSIENPKFRAFRIICVFFIAGALGNFIDRVFYGYVIDFINFEFINFPIFNIADIYLTLSIVILLFLSMFYYKEKDWDFIKKKSYD